MRSGLFHTVATFRAVGYKNNTVKVQLCVVGCHCIASVQNAFLVDHKIERVM